MAIIKTTARPDDITAQYTRDQVFARLEGCRYASHGSIAREAAPTEFHQLCYTNVTDIMENWDLIPQDVRNRLALLGGTSNLNTGVLHNYNYFFARSVIMQLCSEDHVYGHNIAAVAMSQLRDDSKHYMYHETVRKGAACQRRAIQEANKSFNNIKGVFDFTNFDHYFFTLSDAAFPTVDVSVFDYETAEKRQGQLAAIENIMERIKDCFIADGRNKQCALAGAHVVPEISIVRYNPEAGTVTLRPHMHAIVAVHKGISINRPMFRRCFGLGGSTHFHIKQTQLKDIGWVYTKMQYMNKCVDFCDAYDKSWTVDNAVELNGMMDRVYSIVIPIAASLVSFQVGRFHHRAKRTDWVSAHLVRFLRDKVPAVAVAKPKKKARAKMPQAFVAKFMAQTGVTQMTAKAWSLLDKLMPGSCTVGSSVTC